MATKSEILRIIGATLYWLLLVPLLAFYPVLHGWDSLPESLGHRYVLLLILLLVLAVAVVTWRNRRVHFAAVVVLLSAGAFFFARAQGIVEAPDSTDRQILVRATELLADEARWDRSAGNDCKPASATLTLYCALRQGSYDTYGGFRHRRPALQVVRAKIEEHRPDANYDHRLGGFNADSQTGFAELHRLLDASIDEIDRRLE